MIPLVFSLVAVGLVLERPADHLPRGSCEQLFGDRGDRKGNSQRREGSFVELDTVNNTTFVVHRHTWRYPVPLEVEDVEVIESGTDRDGPYAMLELDRMPGCMSGVYRARVDDSFGPQGRILAIDAGIVLLELDKRLFFITADSRSTPRWRMIHRWPYEIPGRSP